MAFFAEFNWVSRNIPISLITIVEVIFILSFDQYDNSVYENSE